MKEKLCFNEMRDMAYNISMKNGFYKPETDTVPVKMMLVITEIAEAVNADRDGKYGFPDEFASRKWLNSHKWVATHKYDSLSVDMFNSLIKHTVPDELADAAIRLLDWAGWKGIDMDMEPPEIYDEFLAGRSFCEVAWYLTNMITRGADDGFMPVMALGFLYAWARHLGIDLMRHIDWKLQYNSLTVGQGKRTY